MTDVRIEGKRYSLDPCPFCKCDNLLCSVGEFNGSSDIDGITCPDCGAEMDAWFCGKTHIVSRWNRRDGVK